MQQKFCPQCNNFSDDKSKYCPECGYNLDVFYSSPEKICTEAENREKSEKYIEAAYLYRCGARNGHAQCMFHFGKLYEHGLGVKQSWEKATYCHSKAAEQSYLPSVQWLYNVYLGRKSGFNPDQENAVSFLQLAAELGDDSAAKELAILGLDGSQNELDLTDSEEEAEEPFDSEQGNIATVTGHIVKRAFVAAKRNHAVKKSKEAIHQEECTHLELLRSAMQQQINILRSESEFTHTASENYDIVDVKVFQGEKERALSAQEKMKFLESRINHPYFGRMLLEGDGEQEDLYIGQDYFMLGDRLIVFSHNAPVPSHIYDRATTFLYGKIKYEVIFKRKFDITNGVLHEVFQSYMKDDYAETDQHKIMYDAFLARILERKKNDARLTDIIATIQENQNQIITRPGSENLIVQGCAGCGKTMILLQRLEYLAFHQDVLLPNVTVIVPSEEFKRHIAPVVHDLNLDRIKIRTIAEFFLDALSRYVKNEEVEKFRNNLITDNFTSDESAAYYYSEEFFQKAQAFVRQIGEAWLVEVKDYDQLLAQFEEVKEEYRTRERWIKNTYCFHCVAHGVTPATQPLLAKKYCAQCVAAKAPLNHRFDVKRPKRPTISLENSELAFNGHKHENRKSRSELYATLLINFLLGGPKSGAKNLFEGNLICIDEGQDLALSEYRLFSAICGKNAVFNVYGDIGQKVNSLPGIQNWEELQSVGSFFVYELNENYRNTQEVTKYINNTLQMNITPLGLEGAQILKINEDEMQRYLGYQSQNARIAIIMSKKNSETFQRLSKVEQWKNYLHTIEECKGLEFDAVFVYDHDMSRNERYIAYSRTLGALFLVS